MLFIRVKCKEDSVHEEIFAPTGAVCIILLALLVGCAPVVEQPPIGPIVLSDELLALLETVNEEHKSIIKPEVDEAAIVERWARDTSKYSLDYQLAGSMTDGVLTAQQAKNDVNVLFYNLQTKYGLYEYFGGDEVFDAAKEAILQACDVAETLTPDELRSILSANLASVNRDAHFYIGWLDNTLTFPFHFRTTAFEKTDNGYQTLEGKKQVSSVDGYEKLDSLFRRSISNEGAIVYYPVVLVELDAQFPRIIPRGNPTYTPRDLVVRFADGTTQLLAAEPFQSGQSSERSVVEMYKNRGIPVLFSGHEWSGIAGNPDRDGRAFLAYAEELKGEHVLIMDLRSTRGGIGILPYKWLHAHLGRTVTGNSCFI